MNDGFYMFSRIHGLENLALVDDEDLELANDPISLQKLVNKVDRHKNQTSTYEDLIEKVKASLKDFKDHVDTMPIL